MLALARGLRERALTDKTVRPCVGLPTLSLSRALYCGVCTAKRGYQKDSFEDVTHKYATQADAASRGVRIFPSFISEHQEQVLTEYFHKQLRKRKYERDHWDGVIEAYRELQRSISVMPKEAQSIVHQCTRAAFRQDAVVQPQVHILDLAPDGYIGFHVDSVKFSGDHVVGLCLLSDAVMRLKHEETSETIDLLLPRRSLYCLRDEARYKFAHAILTNEEATFDGIPVKRDRRITMMLRDELEANNGANSS